MAVCEIERRGVSSINCMTKKRNEHNQQTEGSDFRGTVVPEDGENK